jgi:hypothetical protein
MPRTAHARSCECGQARISDFCGYSIPRYEYLEDRDTRVRWAERKGAAGLDQYRKTKNSRSLDGLPGLLATSE